MTFGKPENLFANRPLQMRSFGVQASELGLDPLGFSPSEARLGYALLGLLLSQDEFGPPAFVNLFLPRNSIAGVDEMPPIRRIRQGVINVAPGCWVDRYQSDFLLDVKAPGSRHVARGTLECDGHAHHDTTYEQASRDRTRDRDFQAMGIAVLRFTALDIRDRPEHCAREAVTVLLRQSAMRGGLA